MQTWVGAIRPPLQVLDHLLDGLEDVLALVGPWDEQGVLTSEAFAAWSSWTGELQRVPALESVDLPGEKRFTEGCLKVKNRETQKSQHLAHFSRSLR